MLPHSQCPVFRGLIPVTSPHLRIIPEVSFPAGEILNVTVGGLRRLGGSQFPEVQLWRTMDGGNEWFKVVAIGSGAAVTYNVALNVHR
jgi:hypothetical protein